jgi:hypothetical protein
MPTTTDSWPHIRWRQPAFTHFTHFTHFNQLPGGKSPLGPEKPGRERRALRLVDNVDCDATCDGTRADGFVLAVLRSYDSR